MLWMWLLGGPTLAHAEADATPLVEIHASGSCPGADRVAEQLNPLLRHHVATTRRETAPVRTAKIYDFGDAYLVRVDGVVRRIPDANRNCEERAQVAAVVVALTLEPAGAESPPEKAPPPEPTSPVEQEVTPAPQPQADHPGSLIISIAAKGLSTFEGFGPDFGPMIGAGWRARNWTLQLSGSVFPARAYDVTDSKVTLARYGFDLRWGPSFRFSPVRIDTTLGLALDPIVITSEVFGTRTTRLDVGPSAALGLALDKWSVNPLLVLDARWFPRNYALLVLPEGEVGRTPSWYFGLSVGVQFNRF